MTFFDYAEAISRRDSGTQAALAFAGDDWRESAIALCRAYFATQLLNHGHNPHWRGDLFESAKRFAIEQGLGDPPSVNSWGAVCLTMAKRKIIVKTGDHATCASASSHGRTNPKWRLAP